MTQGKYAGFRCIFATRTCSRHGHEEPEILIFPVLDPDPEIRGGGWGGRGAGLQKLKLVKNTSLRVIFSSLFSVLHETLHLKLDILRLNCY